MAREQTVETVLTRLGSKNAAIVGQTTLVFFQETLSMPYCL